MSFWIYQIIEMKEINSSRLMKPGGNAPLQVVQLVGHHGFSQLLAPLSRSAADATIPRRKGPLIYIYINIIYINSFIYFKQK